MTAPKRRGAAGLYDPQFEHDACAIGAVADPSSDPSHATLIKALDALDRLAHRGASGAEIDTPTATCPAHGEGGDRRFGAMTTRFSGKDGRVARLHAHEVSGPGDFAKSEGSDFELPADLVPLAMGLLQAQHEGLVDQLGLERDGHGNVLAGEEEWATSVAGVYACGDARRGQWLIVWAIADGRRCAAAVDRYLAALDGGVRGDDLAPALAAG